MILMPVDVKARHGLRLPVELLDMILKDMETETQKACSLVCRVWLDVSRRHLFESTVFRTTTSFDAFLKFLTAHPHISVLIRDLYLFGPTAGVPKNIPSLSPLTLIDIATLMPNVSYITLETVRIVNVPNTDDTKARLASLSGPTRLTEFNLTDCAVGHEVEHSPVAIVHLFHLLEAEVMKIELTCGWAPFPVTSADTDLPLIVVPWRVRHQGICLKNILDTRPTHLSALSQILVPGSLRLLHLSFTEWAHFDEMSRFLRHFGESITEFTITFGYALHNYCYRDHRPSDEEWTSYGFSHLRKLSKLRFDIWSPLSCDYEFESRGWVCTTGLPKFLACFPRDLPLDDGVDIDVSYVGQLGYRGIIMPRPEIEEALLRFENLKLVGLCSKYDYDIAGMIGARAFPKLRNAKKLVCRKIEDDYECCP
ncbi:hypothetical protein OH76DRAFT_1404373 [Lentinus brumalis]|uniref:F-box domain-containing protein n=1 Tax=Lentinus brumalis TaxID=2498619 RepID=A0A371D8H0_9APHY|nr:hypothetical protein OH76DRAFT_1404373 [Polyporus brumalis]